MGPRHLRLRDCSLASLAQQFGLELVGEDRTVSALDYVEAPAALSGVQLTYAVSAEWVNACLGRGIAACLTTQELVRPSRTTSFLLTRADPVGTFFTIFAALQREGRWQQLESVRAPNVEMAPSAVVHDHVVLGPGCRIMDHAVVLPNSWLGEGVVVQPGAVIGGDGFEIKVIDGHRRVVPHAGGVWLGDGVTIGSGTCVDRGLFGEFTTVGAGTMVDNLVHIAHRAVLGRDCSVIACAEISGSVVLGDGVWIGPNVSVNQQLTVGDHAFIGTGAVVTRPVPAFALAYGSPARVRGWRCSCGSSLEADRPAITCASCKQRYQVVGEPPTLRRD